MEFGITLKGDVSVERILELTRRGEQAGFQYGWIFDSHVIWKEPYPLLTLMAASTTKMHLGTCVTNPAVRDVTVTSSLFATLNLISHGRMELGIGRGDSSRRVLGKKPTTLENLEETVTKFRELTAGREIEYDGRPARLPWATGGIPRVWIAGYGPKALHLAGKIGDGVILQLADPVGGAEGMRNSPLGAYAEAIVGPVGPAATSRRVALEAEGILHPGTADRLFAGALSDDFVRLLPGAYQGDGFFAVPWTHDRLSA